MRATRGRSFVGSAATLVILSLRSRNVSICCAMNRNGILYYQSQTTAFNTEFFGNFIVNLSVKLQELNMVHAVLICDNVSFHKVLFIRQKIEDLGYELRFLSPYSLFLNPIENMFSKWKEFVRRESPLDRRICFL
ncbi:hypothetical protein CDIK_2087 [Cucumispora dikerogammari]|nr:hypothetical protein CDIK_2087 [Cucumispora dikerogammari]